jgi:hypothetical protein
MAVLEADEADEMFESDEADEADESDEEAGRVWLRPRVATGQNLYRPRPQTRFVTQAQLQTALAKVSGQIRTNSNAIRQVGNRVSAAAAAIKKETSERKKDLEKVRNALSQTQQMAAILPLLTQPKSVKPKTTTDFDTGTNVLVDGSNTMSLLLPLLLLTSIGDGSGTGGGLFGGTGSIGGTDNTMMMLLVVLAISGALSGKSS